MSSKEISLTCERCGSSFLRTVKRIKNNLSRGRKNYCSLSCNSKKYQIRCVDITCDCCGAHFTKEASQIEKTLNHFCSRSCAATWRNMHKTGGFRRSKLELYLLEKFNTNYPHIKVIPNDRLLTGLELDLLLPNHNIAFEINGICHCKPIYGDAKFQKTLQKDAEKQQICQDMGITLIVIPNLWRTFTLEIGDACWAQYIEPVIP